MKHTANHIDIEPDTKQPSPLDEAKGQSVPSDPSRQARSGRKLTLRRVLAIACIVVLVGMYVATFIVALMDFPGQDRLFQACLVATIGLPILLWIYLWLFDRVREARSQNPEQDPEE